MGVFPFINFKLKNMKKISLFFVMLTILASITFAQNSIVGKLENGKPYLTINEITALSELNAFLKTNSSLNANLDKLTIIEKEQGRFILLATGTEYKSSINLIINANKSLEVESTTVCTTKACSQSSGCEPKPFGQKGCTPCTGDCTKTTSSSKIFSN